MQAQENKVFIVGVGMTKFIKPNRKGNPTYMELVKQAANRALKDAGISYNQVDSAAVGYVFGDSTCGNRALYEVGMTGIPIYNVNNNCATGSTAVYLAYGLIKGGLNDCVLTVGFEMMDRGGINLKVKESTQPINKIYNTSVDLMDKNSDVSQSPFAPLIFGNAGIEHMKKYGTTIDQIAKIAKKNHDHSAKNPYAQLRETYNLEEIKSSPQVYGPLTKLQCCPNSDGAASAILCSEKFLKEHHLEDQAIEIIGISLTTDSSKTFSEKSFMNLAGYEMAKRAAQNAYKQAGLQPKDIQAVELHDCFSVNELITYEALGLCDEGKAGEFIDKGDNTYGGRCVVNPSGGLTAKGHPLGATGLAQLTELCWQLRGMAEDRQIPSLKYALQHNLGLGGACVVAIYKKYNNNKGYTRSDQTSDPVLLEKQEGLNDKQWLFLGKL